MTTEMSASCLTPPSNNGEFTIVSCFGNRSIELEKLGGIVARAVSP